ncbi:hypothetical protein GXP70_28265 [Paenibacillus lycopersici]|uniref:DUF4352 domain-containing protein n=1 Tax=Paenibacillus lycopersici TaxID=2704462 RepID=A0A6C0G558_9BACL|nr:hypothetical protein [Paenibacillus lycopersici]QHT63463.1 hypothetical protein GXP70_28265 [Paenibacillus lycopersici]
MAHKWAKIGVVALASSALLFQNVDLSIPSAAAAASTTTNSISSKIVKLNASAYLSIRDAHLTMQSQGKVLVYTVDITNNGNSSLDLIDYWLRVKTKSGKSFKTTAIDADKDKKDVPAKSTQTLTYYTVVDNQTKLTDLTFQVVKWDFSTANYERVLGNVQYPANGTDKVAAYQASVMRYANNKIRSAVKQSYITTDATNAYLVVNFLVENVGFQASDLSKLNFLVQTDSYSQYNVTVSGLDQNTIQPNERKIVTLRATIPLSVAGKPLSLLVAQNDEGSKIQLPVGLFSMPTMKPLAATAAGKSQMVYMNGSPVTTMAGNVFVSMGASSKDVSVQFKLTNTGTAAVADPNLEYYILTASGTSYPMSYTQDQNAKLLPDIEKNVTLTGQIPKTVNLSNATLVAKSQATEKESAYIVGKYVLQNASDAAAVGKPQKVYVSGTPVNTVAGKVFISQGTSSKNVSMDFRLTNIDKTSIAYPALDYFIVTASGTSYPMSYEKQDNAMLVPNIETTVALNGEVPTNVNLTNAQLVVKSHATDKEQASIIGTYALQSTTQQGSLGGAFIYNDFTVKLNTVQRAPSSDNDVLVATFSVTNRSTATEQIPTLGGYFMVDGVKIGTEQTAAAMDDSVTLAPGASADFVVYSEIPYTTAIDKITFVSTEPVQGKAGKQLYQFSAQQLSDIPTQKLENPYSVKSIGKRSTVNVLRTAVFNGTTKNNFYAEFEAVNNEMRSASIAALGGYIVDKKGIVVPVQFATAKDKLSPSGKALLSAFASIPKSFDVSSYKLILGQSIATSTNGGTGTTGTNGNGSGTDGNDTPATGNPVLVNMVSYPLSDFTPVTSSDLGNIQFAGYTLGLHYINAFLNVAGQFDVNGLKMTLDYNLAKNNDYEVITGDHKLLIEFVNQDNNHVTYSKQFSLLSGAANDQVLTETKDSPLTIVFDNDSEIQSKILHYDTYKVNVYDVFQDSKLLLASKEMNWFTTTP